MSPLKPPQFCTVLTFPVSLRHRDAWHLFGPGGQRQPREFSPVKLNNPDRLRPQNLPLGKHWCVPQDDTGREAKNAEHWPVWLHPRQHLRPAGRQYRWLQMNIKVKLPFLFTFLQLRGATCSGPALARLTEQRRSEPTGSGH